MYICKELDFITNCNNLPRQSASQHTHTHTHTYAHTHTHTYERCSTTSQTAHTIHFREQRSGAMAVLGPVTLYSITITGCTPGCTQHCTVHTHVQAPLKQFLTISQVYDIKSVTYCIYLSNVCLCEFVCVCGGGGVYERTDLIRTAKTPIHFVRKDGLAALERLKRMGSDTKKTG